MLKSIEISGFKSFGEKARLDFLSPISSIVGPNGSGKSNVAEAFRFALGEQSMKSLRGRRSEDLIFNGSHGGARSNRASVKVMLDNTKRILDIDFDEVVIERVVHRDGTHEYKINESRVRRKDIAELLAKANIGSTGHHIISQGEADRILSVSPDERRAMIEDALGLRIFHLKKKESISRLEKTEQNLKEVELLRKEIKPHLHFLKKQIDKAEVARSLEEKLHTMLQHYFSYEEAYIQKERTAIETARHEPYEEHLSLETKIKDLQKILDEENKDDSLKRELESLSGELATLQQKRNTLTHKLGRVEGEIDAFSRIGVAEKRDKVEEGVLSIPHTKVVSFFKEIKSRIQESLSGDEGVDIKETLRELPSLFDIFLDSFTKKKESPEKEIIPVATSQTLLEEKKNVLQKEILRVDERKAAILETERRIQERYTTDREEHFRAERDLFKVLAHKNELGSVLDRIREKSLILDKREENFKKDIGEIAMIFGRKVLQYGIYQGDFDEEEHQKEYREIERLRIKLEEMGIGSISEVEKEYEDVRLRDEFLAKEIEDLSRSRKSLLEMIGDIEKELNERFRKGIETITLQFSEFFKTMFGGGYAELVLVTPKKRKKSNSLLDEMGEEEIKEGIEIEVHLPKKKIHSLDMLSGGERALTSIALLFALSQINPPPFIILDETDAALDEANSKRYGDMIESLSRYSQLILITHNRETMSRAGLLYGVTMKQDGISRLLSIAFDEAVLVAK